LDGHIHGFDFFGGIFPVLIYDNLKAAVLRVLRGKDRIEQEAFSKFKAYYNFEARFCNCASGNEKGGVEGLVGYARRNYMVPIPEASSLVELNEKILKQCICYGNHKMEGRDKTVKQLYEEERQHLIAIPSIEYSNVQTIECRVDKYATVMVDKNRYSLPSRYTGIQVKVLLKVDKMEFYYGGKILAVHERVYGNNQWKLNPDHYLELIQQRPQSFNSARPIRQWRQVWPESLNVLLTIFIEAQGESNGIKDFISVLMLYRQYSADEVESAVELALESKISSSEGVRHILIYTKGNEVPITPLANWPSLESVDVSVYGQLGGVI
jgi:hypothetical protein